MRLLHYIRHEIQDAYDNALLLLNPESNVRKLSSLRIDELCFTVINLFDEDYEFYKDTTKTIRIELYRLMNQATLSESETHLKKLYESFLASAEALKIAQGTDSSVREENVTKAFKTLQARLLLIRQYTRVV